MSICLSCSELSVLVSEAKLISDTYELALRCSSNTSSLCLLSLTPSLHLKGEARGLGTHCMCATGTQCSRSRRPPGNTLLSSSPPRGWMPEKRSRHRKAKEQTHGARRGLRTALRSGLTVCEGLAALCSEGGLPPAPSCSRGWHLPFSPRSRMCSECLPESGPAPFRRASDAGLLGPLAKEETKGQRPACCQGRPARKGDPGSLPEITAL